MSTSPAATLTPCPDPPTLGKLLRDELSPDEAGRVEEHVGACRGCQRVLEGLVGSLPDTVAGPAGPREGAADEEPPRLPGCAPLCRIDAGGMGVVWRVRDLQFQRDLAVKVMKARACDDPNMVRRFVGEARVCGQLAHPFIVPVHAMGRLADGRPYYAMKLVEGQTLAALLAGGLASAGRRTEAVRTFGQLCQAVAFAHGKGVIHRDLKPDNVMVGAHGEVQVMDWGLAKRLADAPAGPGEESAPPAVESGDGESHQTRAGSVLGTPCYMPPEQAAGRLAEVDRRSDVFALGAILCEILTGDPPYTGPDAAVVHRRATDADLAEARVRLRGCGADPELTGLAERCLSPEKTDRPADAGEVAAAVAAYLSGVEERLQQERLRREHEQVRAAEERRRRRLWLGLAGALLGVLVVGIVGTTLGLIRAERARAAEEKQRDIAEAEQKRAVEFRDKALDALRATTDEDVQKLIGEKKELGANERAYLEAIAKRWQVFAAQEGDDEQSRALRGEGHVRVAFLWDKLGRRNEARTEYEQARDIRQKLAAEFPAAIDYQYDLLKTHSLLADLLTNLGVYDQARVEHERALDIEQQLVARSPADPEWQRRLANTRNDLGRLLGTLGKWDEARGEFEQARDIQQKLVAQLPAEPKLQRGLANTHTNLGMVLDMLGKGNDARVEYEQALTILNQLTARFPDVPDFQQTLVRTHVNLGVLEESLGKPDAARVELEQARDIQKKLAAQFPLVPDYQYHLAAAHNNLGGILKTLGKWDEARSEYKQALDIRQKLVTQFPDVPTYQVELGGTYCNLGLFFLDRGLPADSVPWFDKAIATLTALHAKEPRDVTAKQYLRNSYWDRARALDRLHRYTDSVKDWRKATELSPQSAKSQFRTSRATSLARAGQVAEAVADIAELTAAREWDSDQWYNFACFYAVASGKATDKKQEYADRAMELLRKAVQAGWKNGAHMSRDSDLDPLREREDFKRLLADLRSRE
jgi:tetratricopeptide (TPR) repeat protein